MKRVVSRRTFVRAKVWKCSACGADTSGAQMLCANCGKQKEAEKYTAPSSPQPEVTDPVQLAQAAAGSNWKCEHCGGQERALNGGCRRCGAAKPLILEAATTRSNIARFMPRSRIRIAIGIGVAALMAFGVALLVQACRPTYTQGTVEAMTWERTVVLEHRHVHPGENWDDEMHSGAYDLSCESRKRGTRECNPYKCNPHPVSYDCNPYDCDCSTREANCRDLENGFEECEEVTECDTCYETCTKTGYDTCYEKCDVMDDWCSYRYDTWEEAARVRHHGGQELEATWPSQYDAPVPNMRTRRFEAYTVAFGRETKKGRKTETYETASFTDYQRFAPGEIWSLKIFHNGKVTPLKRLQAEQE